MKYFGYHCYGLDYLPQIPTLKLQLPVPQNVTVWGDIKLFNYY